jgi:hypothetical protein
MKSMRMYAQGALGAAVVIVLFLVGSAIWDHAWADRWQSEELYRLRARVDAAEKLNAEQSRALGEAVNWINGVIANQQRAQGAPAPGVPAPKAPGR